jgi:hypothetical protein
MWTPLITLIATVLLVLITAAGAVALTVRDHQHGQRALTLLKILVGATLGSTGLFAAIIQLHQAGLL